MSENMQNTRVLYGSFLIIPLKYDMSSFDRARLEKTAVYRPVTTMDLNENIKKMLDRSNPAAVGSCYEIDCHYLMSPLADIPQDADRQKFLVDDTENVYPFELSKSYIYLFHTQVAFLCLSLSFSQIQTMETICNPGFAYNPATFYWVDGENEKHLFSVESWLDGVLSPLGFSKFFDGESSYLLDAYSYIFAVVPERFDTLEEMQKITFNLHKMLPYDDDMYDDSEDDIRYAYSVKNQDLKTYRWGCCIASQTISYVIADKNMDFEAQRADQASDGMPVVLLSLYEKYTCLRFTELITNVKKGQIKQLKNMMLEFKAYGTVTPANLSRWHNVKQIYAHLLQVNDIATAIQDISGKLNILTEHQEEIERAKSETVVNIITIFGIVSILASVLSIVQLLSGGNVIIWASTILTALMLLLITTVAVWKNRKW